MKSTSLFLTIASGVGLCSATPSQLQKRAEGTEQDPIIVPVDCAGVEPVCNADCYAILCLFAPNPTRYQAKWGGEKRKKSGYSSKVLKLDYDGRLAVGIDISDAVLDKVGRSMEETIMANAEQGGEGEIIVPVQPNQNTHAGSKIWGGMRRSGVTDNMWYKRNFQNFGAMAPYCTFLQAGDHSICTRDGKSDDDPARIAFTRVQPEDGDTGSHYHMLDPENLGDFWSGHYWQPGPSQKVRREVDEIDSDMDGKED